MERMPTEVTWVPSSMTRRIGQAWLWGVPW